MAKLYYVMGASGVGKDSLLQFARCHQVESSNLVFAHRYITRPASTKGENHVALSEAEFALRSKHGCFALRWQSHGTSYGIGEEINSWLAAGLSVVVNGSRAYLDQAITAYPELIPILISASEAQLRSRLEARGREHGADLEQRLLRTSLLNIRMSHPRLVKIDNSGELADAGRQLLQVLSGRADSLCG